MWLNPLKLLFHWIQKSSFYPAILFLDCRREAATQLPDWKYHPPSHIHHSRNCDAFEIQWFIRWDSSITFGRIVSFLHQQTPWAQSSHQHGSAQESENKGLNALNLVHGSNLWFRTLWSNKEREAFLWFLGRSLNVSRSSLSDAYKVCCVMESWPAYFTAWIAPPSTRWVAKDVGRYGDW